MAVSYFDSLHPNSLAMNHAFHLSLACLLMITGTSVLGQMGEARVLVIGIDGTRPDCLEAAETPALDALIDRDRWDTARLSRSGRNTCPGRLDCRWHIQPRRTQQ